jgi:recombination protein RecA
MTKNKQSARANLVEQAFKEVNATFGADTVIRLGKRKLVDVDVFPTGIVTVDWDVIGAGGIPRAKITELSGPEHGGKSTIAMQTVATAQHMGEQAVYIDVEHSFDPIYAKRLGVDVSDMIISQPDYGEQALDIVEKFLVTGAVGIIVVDSVAMLTPKAELEGEMSDQHVGLLSRMMTQALRRLTVTVRKTNTALVFINQLRDKIGVTWGETTTTPGGRALKHNSSLRMDMQKISNLKKGDKVIGSRVKFRGKKNRVGDPYQEADIDLLLGNGFSREADIVDQGVRTGILEKEGNTYAFGGERLGVGREAARSTLTERHDIFDSVYSLVVEKKREARNARDSEGEP